MGVVLAPTDDKLTMLGMGGELTMVGMDSCQGPLLLLSTQSKALGYLRDKRKRLFQLCT